MNNSPHLVPRYRVNKVLAILILIGALTSSPTPANVEPLCDIGCVYWIKGIGCLDCQRCCVLDSNGNFECTHNYDLRDCGTGGPEGN